MEPYNIYVEQLGDNIRQEPLRTTHCRNVQVHTTLHPTASFSTGILYAARLIQAEMENTEILSLVRFYTYFMELAMESVCYLLMIENNYDPKYYEFICL